MACTDPGLAMEFCEDVLAALTPDRENPTDRFVPIYLGKEAIETVGLDRRFCGVIVAGPDPVRGGCTEHLWTEWVFRYYTERASRLRMLRDVGLIGRTLRHLASVDVVALGLSPSMQAVKPSMRLTSCEKPSYDYESILGLTLVTFPVRLEYHVGP